MLPLRGSAIARRRTILLTLGRSPVLLPRWGAVLRLAGRRTVPLRGRASVPLRGSTVLAALGRSAAVGLRRSPTVLLRRRRLLLLRIRRVRRRLTTLLGVGRVRRLALPTLRRVRRVRGCAAAVALRRPLRRTLRHE